MQWSPLGLCDERWFHFPPLTCCWRCLPLKPARSHLCCSLGSYFERLHSSSCTRPSGREHYCPTSLRLRIVFSSEPWSSEWEAAAPGCLNHLGRVRSQTFAFGGQACWWILSFRLLQAPYHWTSWTAQSYACLGCLSQFIIECLGQRWCFCAAHLFLASRAFDLQFLYLSERLSLYA